MAQRAIEEIEINAHKWNAIVRQRDSRIDYLERELHKYVHQLAVASSGWTESKTIIDELREENRRLVSEDEHVRTYIASLFATIQTQDDIIQRQDDHLAALGAASPYARTREVT
jgi:transcription antitermination factor NusA-like protein